MKEKPKSIGLVLAQLPSTRSGAPLAVELQQAKKSLPQLVPCGSGRAVLEKIL